MKLRKILNEVKKERNFKFRDVTLHTIEKLKTNELEISATLKDFGKEYSYKVKIPNDNYRLSDKSDLELISMKVADKIKEKIYG